MDGAYVKVLQSHGNMLHSRFVRVASKTATRISARSGSERPVLRKQVADNLWLAVRITIYII